MQEVRLAGRSGIFEDMEIEVEQECVPTGLSGNRERNQRCTLQNTEYGCRRISD